MRGVNINKAEPVDRALKRLKSMLDNEGILEEMRRRRAFETPVQRQKRKSRSAAKKKNQRWKYISPEQEAAMAAEKAAAQES